jgi:hypothetical protein
MSIATFESPHVASQRFFPWVFGDEMDCDCAAQDLPDDLALDSVPDVQAVADSPATLAFELTSRALPVQASNLRLAAPVRIGAVMLKLLKSYGITDEEIAAGVAAYAAKAGLAQAG